MTNFNHSIKQLYNYIKDGNLEELKKIQKSMQTDRFLSLKQYGGYTMLIFAATHGYIDILEYLIKLGADVNEVSNVSKKSINIY